MEYGRSHDHDDDATHTHLDLPIFAALGPLPSPWGSNLPNLWFIMLYLNQLTGEDLQ